MHTKIRDRLYDRLAALAGNDGGRLMNEISRLSAAERQRAFRERRAAEGKRRAVLWITPAQGDALRSRFPGPRGGIEWNAVITAALSTNRRNT